MRRTYGIAAMLLLIGPQVLTAQQMKPAGVVAPRNAERATALPSPTDLRPAVAPDSSKGHPWRWVGVGALVGGVAGGVAAGVSASQGDDQMTGLAAPAIIAVALVGAVTGGLVGGLAWLMSR